MGGGRHGARGDVSKVPDDALAAELQAAVGAGRECRPGHVALAAFGVRRRFARPLGGQMFLNVGKFGDCFTLNYCLKH